MKTNNYIAKRSRELYNDEKKNGLFRIHDEINGHVIRFNPWWRMNFKGYCLTRQMSHSQRGGTPNRVRQIGKGAPAKWNEEEKKTDYFQLMVDFVVLTACCHLAN